MAREFKEKLSEIELLLKKNYLDKGILELDELKQRFSSYAKLEEGYLVDFYLSQAFFRRCSDNGFISKEDFEKVVSLGNKSLEVNPNFSDTHLLLLWAHTLRYKSEDKDKKEIKSSARYHAEKARFLNKNFSNECDKCLSCFAEFDLILCGKDETKMDFLRNEFRDYQKVLIKIGDILDQQCNALVSPANSFGFMDGGLDLQISEHFGWDLERKVQDIIKSNHSGELLVGQAEILPTEREDIPYLISAPTMRIPMVLPENSINVYLSTMAVLNSIENFNKDQIKIKSVAMPFMGTGVGGMKYTTASRQMRIAYDDIILGKLTFPEDLGEAIEKERILSSDEYYQNKLNNFHG